MIHLAEHVEQLCVYDDWATGGWHDPIGIFTDVLQAEFCDHHAR